MDSYASIAADGSVSSNELDEKWKEQMSGQEVLSPASIELEDGSSGVTERQPSRNPFDKLRAVVTDLPKSAHRGGDDKGGDDEVEPAVCTSPTSEGSTPVSPMIKTALLER